jgi:hypothetical protein
MYFGQYRYRLDNLEYWVVGYMSSLDGARLKEFYSSNYNLCFQIIYFHLVTINLGFTTMVYVIQ